MKEPIYTLHQGSTPLLVSLPHAGTHIPAALHGRLQPRALDVEDTDWFLDRLYAFATEIGAGLIVPMHSRYVIDLNRPRDNRPMYAGANNTELCPTRFFTGDALYIDGQAPTAAEIAHRADTYWAPYHDALQHELARLKAEHGHAVLFDGHSIKSELPWLFDGRLPHLNLGTASGTSCAPSLTAALANVLGTQQSYSHVIDGRFKGGYITRRHGRPADGVHAVQLEMSWRCYLDEADPARWQADKAAAITPLLHGLVQAMIDWQP